MKASFKEVINSDKPVLIDFYADWCGPCKAMQPVLESVSKKVGDTAKILKINVDKNQAISEQYNIRSIPTLILFKNGKELWRVSGAQSEQALVSVINQHL